MKRHPIIKGVAERKTGPVESKVAGIEVLGMENTDKFAFVRVCACIFERGYKNLRYAIYDLRGFLPFQHSVAMVQ
jgi:hypothetical protein